MSFSLTMSILGLPEGERRAVHAPLPLALHYRETLSHRLLEVVQASGLVEGLIQTKLIMVIHIMPMFAIEGGLAVLVVRFPRDPDLVDRFPVDLKGDGDVRVLFGILLDNRLNEGLVRAVDGFLDEVINKLFLIHIEELLVVRLVLGTKVFSLEGREVPQGPEKSDFFHGIIRISDRTHAHK